jgi:hypothetical protein
MFAVLFGLSMHYEGFLLSRVWEEYLARGDTARAVTEGPRPYRPRDHRGGADHGRRSEPSR